MSSDPTWDLASALVLTLVTWQTYGHVAKGSASASVRVMSDGVSDLMPDDQPARPARTGVP